MRMEFNQANVFDRAGRLVSRFRSNHVLVLAAAAVVCLGASCETQGQLQTTAATSLKGNAVKSDYEGSLQHGGRTRTYHVHLPPGYDPAKRYPLMLSFHAMLGNADVQRRQTKMNAVAENHGFIMVYPNGTGAIPGRLTWNAGTCCAYAVRENVDDVGFVRALLDTLPKSYAIDTRRVYATGMSNGGMLCYRLACEMPERIAAIAPVAADLGVDGPVPNRPVSIIHFHGLKDTFKPYEGGIGKVMGVKHRPIPETIAWWVKADHCAPEPADVVKNADYTLTRYRPPAGKEGAPIDYYLLPQGGHTWPGGEDVSARLGTGTLIKTVNASELIWKFCEQFSLPEKTAAK